WPHTNSLEAFLDSTGSLTSPKTARHHASAPWCADLPTHRPTRLPPDNHHRVELPTCVTPSLTYYKIGSHTSNPHNPKAMQDTSTVSITCLGMNARARVRESTPGLHRLRLAASPSVQTHPGPINLPQEPLVNQR